MKAGIRLKWSIFEISLEKAYRRDFLISRPIGVINPYKILYSYKQKISLLKMFPISTLIRPIKNVPGLEGSPIGNFETPIGAIFRL